MGMPSLSLKINVCSDVHENIWTMQKCVKRARKMISSATPIRVATRTKLYTEKMTTVLHASSKT